MLQQVHTIACCTPHSSGYISTQGSAVVLLAVAKFEIWILHLEFYNHFKFFQYHFTNTEKCGD